MRDSGIDGVEQNKFKSKYYDYLIEYCKEFNVKVIFIFDELHESIGSFRKDLIPYLFKWKDVIYKIFAVSATFTESTIPIIKLLAQLTDKKIKILEGNRVQKDVLSDLYLYFYNVPTYKIDYPAFTDVFKTAVSRKKYATINVLTYSESIAKKIVESNLGAYLKNKFKQINLCTSKSDNFNSIGSNVGTKFKTGVNFTVKDSALVILLPPSFIDINNRGIFSDGINSVIQAVARARNPNIDIHIIMSSPNKTIGNSQYLDLNDIYLSNTDYLSLSEQNRILKKEYDERKRAISIEEKLVSQLDSDIKVEIDSFDWYKLVEGDKYLHNNYDIFGKNLSNYTTWAAYNNQFVNCRLKSVFVRDVIKFYKDGILKGLDEHFSKSVIDSESFYLESDLSIFYNLYNELFQSRVKLVKDKDSEKKITPSTSSLFNHQILRFLQRRKTPYLYSKNDLLEDKKLSKESILRILISQSLDLAGLDKDYSEDERSLILALNQLSLFGSILETEYGRTDSNNASKKYLPIDKEFNFKVLHRIQIDGIIAILKSNKLIKFLMNLNNLKNDSSIYSLLRKIFFKCKESSFQNKKFLLIEKVRKIEYSEYHVNLLYDFKTPEVYFPFDPKRTSYIKITDEDFEYEKKYTKPSDV